MTLPRLGALAAALAVAAIAGCGRSEAPKADASAERAAATERAKKSAFGPSVTANEMAKEISGDLNRKAQEGLETADKMSK
jgi:hypothetical protein